MKKYPLEKFPKTVLRPDVVANHEKHIKSLTNIVEEYSTVGHRDQTLFDWLLMVFENLGASTVKKEYLDSLAIIKTKLSMFVILIDDTVDNIKERNFKLFEELLKIPFYQSYINRDRLNSEDIKYLEFTQKVWAEIEKEMKTYPNYEKYKDAFNFDLKQVLNSMEYSRFVNTNQNAINLLENSAYVHHAMIVLLQLDFDLMCSERFDDRELGTLREFAYLSQKMARIGNVIGTYPRELIESDMSSEALIRFQKDYGTDFNFKLNKFLNRERRYPKFEKELIEEWEKEYEVAREIALRIKSIDMEQFLKERQFIQDAYVILVEDY